MVLQPVLHDWYNKYHGMQWRIQKIHECECVCVCGGGGGGG